MRARAVVGRRIVGVEHVRWFNTQLGRIQTDCIRIRLDDGSSIVADAFETENGGPETDMRHVPRRRVLP